MQLANSQTRYGSVPQLLHWLTFICVIAAWVIGFFFDDFPRASHPVLLFIHMTLGQSVLALLVVRLVWRFVDPPPPLVETRLGRLLAIVARLNHCAIYVLLLAVPVVGILVQLKRGRALPIFGIWEFASPWPMDRALSRSIREIHGLLANTLLALVGIHAAAALIHHYVLRDATLWRMLPGGRASEAAGADAAKTGALSP
jgi:cytochrome b561